ncbi:MAG: isoprenylcysteine carboxylmethyltransferase family protein [Zetaproteobacteria bacterium]|nr:isoprenylcysteine carboxylmethyltransferase family protein [Zetaproteobacteria bacterium]
MNATTSSANKASGLGKWLFENRDYTPIPLILLLAFISKANALSATLGLLVILCGEAIRIYSVAFIGTVSRTRSTSLGENLITSGPFFWVRNPLYLANFLIVTGVGIFSAKIWFVLVVTLLFFVQYFPIIQYEEQLLEERFGDEYRSYRARTPMWWPNKLPNPEQLESPTTILPALQSEKRTITAIAAVILLMLL